MRFFTDVKKQAIAEGTYINDYQVGELLKNNGLLILNVTNFFGWSTSLNRITHYIKKVDKFILAANFIKKKFFQIF